jgi:hypothetical protein
MGLSSTLPRAVTNCYTKSEISVAPALPVAVSSALANGFGASSSRINSARWRRHRVSAGPAVASAASISCQHPRQRDGERDEGSV